MADEDVIKEFVDHQDFFMNASPRNIMEVVVNIYKQDVIENNKVSICGKNPSDYLVETIELDLGKLDSMFSTESSLHGRINSSYFGSASEPIYKCLNASRCGELQKITKSLGNNQLINPLSSTLSLTIRFILLMKRTTIHLQPLFPFAHLLGTCL